MNGHDPDSHSFDTGEFGYAGAMKKALKRDVGLTAAMLAAAIAPLGACTAQNGSQPTTSGAPAGVERMSTQLKSADGTAIANATVDFANGYATVTVEAGPNQVLTPGFHGLQVHSVGECQANSAAPAGGSTGDFYSAGSVYQAPNHTGYPASGDLTALEVRPDGSAKLVTTTSAFTTADLRNSSGTALILHQDPGNLGAGATEDSSKRIACGVIAAATASSSSMTATTSISTVTTTVAVPPPSTSTSTSTSTVTVTTYPPTSPTTTYSPPPGG